MFHFSSEEGLTYNQNADLQTALSYGYLPPLHNQVYMYNNYFLFDFSTNFPIITIPTIKQETNQATATIENSSDPSDGLISSVIEEQKNKITKNKKRGEEVRQKFGRNIRSNIMHLIVRFVKGGKRLRKVIETIILRDKMTIKTGEFLQMMQRESKKLGAYITTKKMQQLWKGTQNQRNSQEKVIKEKEFRKIFRILAKIYLLDYHLPYLYNSNKIKKASKHLHATQIRRILSL